MCGWRVEGAADSSRRLLTSHSRMQVVAIHFGHLKLLSLFDKATIFFVIRVTARYCCIIALASAGTIISISNSQSWCRKNVFLIDFSFPLRTGKILWLFQIQIQTLYNEYSSISRGDCRHSNQLRASKTSEYVLTHRSHHVKWKEENDPLVDI